MTPPPAITTSYLSLPREAKPRTSRPDDLEEKALLALQ
jgi:hypothetical protein